MIKRKSKHEYQVNVPINNPVTRDDIEEMHVWCNTVFGPGGRNKQYRWRYGWIQRRTDSFYFRNEKDAMLFVLRWS